MSNSTHLILTVLLCVGCARPDELEFTAESLDLGPALPGTLRQAQVKLINQSSSLLHLSGSNSTSPDFSLLLPLQTALVPNEPTTLMVQHVPPLGATRSQTARLSVWTLEGQEATLEVQSLPVTPDCELPERLDFGTVTPGESMTIELPLRNDTAVDDGAEVSAVTGPPGVFVVERGRVFIPAGGEVRLPITLQAIDDGHLEGTLNVSRHHLCKPQPVVLIGTAVENIVSIEPNPVIWLTPVGSSQSQLLILKNHRLIPVSVFDVRTMEGAGPSQVFRATRVPLLIPAARRMNNGPPIPGEATIEVSFTPIAIETRVGQLWMSTDLHQQPSLSLELVGVAP